MARSCHQAWRQMVPASRQDSEVSLCPHTQIEFLILLICRSVSFSLAPLRSFLSACSSSLPIYFALSHMRLFIELAALLPICFPLSASLPLSPSLTSSPELMSIWVEKSTEAAEDYCLCVLATSSSSPAPLRF